MSVVEGPNPTKGFVVTTLLIVKDVKRSREYYAKVFDAKVIDEEDPAVLRLANTWLMINRGGAPTDDKPTVTAAPPADPDRLSIAMNFRVARIFLPNPKSMTAKSAVTSAIPMTISSKSAKPRNRQARALFSEWCKISGIASKNSFTRSSGVCTNVFARRSSSLVEGRTLSPHSSRRYQFRLTPTASAASSCVTCRPRRIGTRSQVPSVSVSGGIRRRRTRRKAPNSDSGLPNSMYIRLILRG